METNAASSAGAPTQAPHSPSDPLHHGHGHPAAFWPLTLGALGVVFGDIGTSPLYTIKECILHARMETGGQFVRDDLFGILSLIFWSMTLVVTVKYLLFIMKADNKGEGGIFALLALVPREMRDTARGRPKVLSLLAVLGAALLYGDGVITPAISVLGAVEGIAVANPSLESAIVPVSIAILIGLFAIQSSGTGTVGKLFGPVMLVWFLTLGGLGLYHISRDPEILAAMLPYHAVNYFVHHGFRGLTILSAVVLAVTGGEALYADMGHFGLRPIRAAWLFVALPALVLNYFGQGANILLHPETAMNPFFGLVSGDIATYALVGLSSCAAVIASQALISGAFSLTRQAIQLGFLPRLRVRHTARDMEGQIYIGFVNYALATGCVLLVAFFRSSTNLAAAYGIAVTGTMAITSMMYYIITRETWRWRASQAIPLLALFLALDVPFLAANLTKFFAGGYVPVLIAIWMLATMIIWNRGRNLVAERYRTAFPTPEAAERQMRERLTTRVPGTAVFMSSNPGSLPPILVYHVNHTRALHENVVLVHVRFTDFPAVPAAERTEVKRLHDGFWLITLRFGFMEDPKVVKALDDAAEAHGIPWNRRDLVYFLGRESFIGSKLGRMGPIEENVFAFMQRNTTPMDRYFGLPHRRVIEIGTQMDL
jgi:KUP system potassium uptake protein